MCKMVFIGTASELEEIPFDQNIPDFSVEPLTNEFLQVDDKFKNPNIYFVGTSRGCSCDFGVRKLPADEKKKREEKQERIQKSAEKIAEHVRKLLGTQKNWQEKQTITKVQLQKDEENYKLQTLKLIELIDNNCDNVNTVELYCCWAGDYNSIVGEYKMVDLKEINLRQGFEIEEKELVTFKK